MAKNDQMIALDDRMRMVAEFRASGGSVSVSTEMLSYSDQDRRYVFRAVLTVQRGDAIETITAHGDADPSNTGRMIHPHLLRMAETRAIVRALRFAGFGEGTGREELGGGNLADVEPQHDPSWERDRARFCARLGELGTTYEAVKARCQADGWGKPSTWSHDDRELFLADLARGEITL